MSVTLIKGERAVNFIELCKVKISLFSACSALAGFLCSPDHSPVKTSLLFGGMFLLASGSSSLNQYQERNIDILMPRTAERPIPSARTGAFQALSFSCLLIGTGTLVLAAAISLAAGMLGLGTVLWYNGLYTCLKKKSAYAILPGALTGIMPPVIGWVAGGGVLTDPCLVYLCCFFFLWQIAHSLLIIIEYGKEFELAGLPSLTMVFTSRQLSRITSIWIFAVGITCLLLPLFVSPPPLDLWLVLLMGVFLRLTFSAGQLLQDRSIAYSTLSKSLYAVMSIILIALTAPESLRRILSGQ